MFSSWRRKSLRWPFSTLIFSKEDSRCRSQPITGWFLHPSSSQSCHHRTGPSLNLLACGGVARGCAAVPSSSLRVAGFTGSCWRSDAGGRTSPPPRRCRRRLLGTKTKRTSRRTALGRRSWQKNLGAVLRWWAGTCVAAVQVNPRAVVSAPAAHHVVLEVRLRHVQGRVDLNLQDTVGFLST